MDNKKLDGFALSIVAIVFAFLMPIVCYICGGIGLHKANEQIRQDPTTPTTARTICITAMWITTGLLVLTVIIRMATGA